MIIPSKYPKQARIDELVAECRSRGYLVEVGSANPDLEFDLVARKGDQTVAHEVRVPDHPVELNGHSKRLRDLATARGYTRLYRSTVPVPRLAAVRIDDLDRQFLEYTACRLPEMINDDTTKAVVTAVDLLQYDDLPIDPDSIRARGTGVILADVHFTGQDLPAEAEFSFRFEVVLDHQLRIQDLRSMDINISGYEPMPIPA